MKKNYVKIILDLLMAITFALLMNPRVLDGLPFHEIAGLILGVAILTHIGLNFGWVINTTKKIFNPNLPARTRFSYLLNILLLISMAVVIITGILISRVVFPNLAIQGGRGIRGIHSFFADFTIVILGLHIGVHWQWIMGICKKVLKTKEGKFRIGGLVSVLVLLALVAGGIQWFSSTSSSSQSNSKPNFSQQLNQTSNNGVTGSSTQMNVTGSNANFQGQPNGDFGERHGDGEFGGRSGSPFLVIFRYFLILAVLIVPTYYIEKRILRNKRKSKQVTEK